jgi:hypothetical protein
VKDREAAPHFNGKDTTSRFAAKDRESDPAVPRIGAVPTRRAEGGREPRKKGDDVGDWRRSELIPSNSGNDFIDVVTDRC